LIDKPYIELGERLYGLSVKCWDRREGLLEIIQIVQKVISDNNYIITVHSYRTDAYLPHGTVIKGSGIVDPHFKVSLLKNGTKTEVITEERGRAYGRKEYYSSEVRSWLNGSNRCSRHR